jgi:hypothetical protein
MPGFSKVTLVGGDEKPGGEYNIKTPPKAATILCWKIHLVKMNVFACRTCVPAVGRAASGFLKSEKNDASCRTVTRI